MVLGLNLLIGGLIVIVITTAEPNFLFYVMQQPLGQSQVLGLVLTLTGFLILLAGFAMAVHYDRQRSWHLKEMEKSNVIRNTKVTIRTADELLKELSDRNTDK